MKCDTRSSYGHRLAGLTVTLFLLFSCYSAVPSFASAPPKAAKAIDTSGLVQVPDPLSGTTREPVPDRRASKAPLGRQLVHGESAAAVDTMVGPSDTG